LTGKAVLGFLILGVAFGMSLDQGITGDFDSVVIVYIVLASGITLLAISVAENEMKKRNMVMR